MVKISSYVFFDIETTGLPHQEWNKTKITELSFVAALRNDLEIALTGSRPYVSKLTLLFNPQRKIHPEVTMLTGLTNDSLKNAPIFKNNIQTIVNFLDELPKPTCLVAHNGNRFDYKILLAEFLDANMCLPQDLLCVDSLSGFQNVFKSKISPTQSDVRKDDTLLRENSLVRDNSIIEEDSLARANSMISEDSLISEDWPDLDISTEDWREIDSLSSSFSEMPFETSSKQEDKKSNTENGVEKISYTLPNLYRRLLKKEVYNAHRAEDDCLMLLECVVATKEFLAWADRYCKSIHDITPLDRNKYRKT